MTKRFWRDPNTWIGIGLAVVVIPMLIWAIVHHVRRGPEDNGFMTVMIDGQETELRPRFGPGVGGLWNVVSDNSVDHRYVAKAAERWNTVLGFKVFDARQDQSFFDDPNYTLRNDYKFGYVTITVATEPGGEHCGGITHHNYDKATGEVYWAEITINPMYTHDSASYEGAVMHELGHALLLAHDDEGLMRKRLDIRGKISSHDIKILREQWTASQQLTP